MEFKNVGIEDITIVMEYFAKQSSRMSDFSAGTFFEWAEYLTTQYAISGDALYIRFFDSSHGHYIYACAAELSSADELKTIVDNIIDEVGGKHAVVLAAYPEEKLNLLHEFYNVRYRYERMWSDYLYDANSFRTFSGKKLHAKRNHISRFKREYGSYSFEMLTTDNLPDALNMLELYSKPDIHPANDGQPLTTPLEDDKNSKDDNNSKDDKDSKDNKDSRGDKDSKDYKDSNVLYEYELRKSRELLTNFVELGVFGGMIRLDGKVIGITAGTIVGDTLFVHLEKALREYLGVYPVLANEFAKQFPSIAFINREDDAGDEGLRKSKLSYYPIKLIDKYLVYIDSKKQ